MSKSLQLHVGVHSNTNPSTTRSPHTSILKKSVTQCEKPTQNTGLAGAGAVGGRIDGRLRYLRSDSETMSDDTLLESNDEGIGTDHLDEKIDDGQIKSAKELEKYISKEMLESGKKLMQEVEPLPLVQLQLPSIVIQGDGCEKLSPVSSRSESPLR